MKLLVWVPSYEWKLPTNLVSFFQSMQLPTDCPVWYCYTTRTPVHMARNTIMRKFLDWNYTHLIMIDDDEYPENRDCFFKLLSSDKDMISGIVRLRGERDKLNILDTVPYLKNWCEWMVEYKKMEKLPSNWVFEIGNAWSGLVCFKRNVVEHMMKKYHNEPFESKQITYVKLKNWTYREFGFHNHDDVLFKEDWDAYLVRRVLSEDFLFFERAIADWFKLYANGECKVVHIWDEHIKV